MKLGLTAIASYVPDDRIDNYSRFSEFNIDAKFLEEKIGVATVARMKSTESVVDLCLSAYARLKEKVEASTLDKIDCIVVCTQNPDNGGLPHNSALIHGHIKANSHCACFDISLGCSGFVHGLNVVTAFMEANGLQNGLFFTCDPYSRIVDMSDRNTAMIFGDAAAVSFIRPIKEGGFTSKIARYYTEGQRAGALCKKGDSLHMDGRAVFNFSATVVPQEIKALLDDCHLSIEEIDYFFLHQGSKYIVDTIRNRLSLPAGKVYLKLKDQGNTVSSSIPLMLEEVMDKPLIKKVIACGFGVGLSVATCLLTRNE